MLLDSDASVEMNLKGHLSMNKSASNYSQVYPVLMVERKGMQQTLK